MKVKDLVCGMEVDPEECKNNLRHVILNGKVYYFCSPFCTAAFLEDPSKYTEENKKNNKDDNERFKSSD